MPFPAIYSTVTMRYGVPERPLQLCVFHYTGSGAPTGGDWQAAAQEWADDLRDRTEDLLGAVVTTETEKVGIHVSVNNSGVTYDAIAPYLTPDGTIASDTLPEYCAVVIQKRTAVGGRTGRGRWFMGCVAEDSTDASQVESTAAALYEGLFDQLILTTTVAGIAWAAALMSRTATELYPIVSRHVNEHLGTQRRRRVRPLL